MIIMPSDSVDAELRIWLLGGFRVALGSRLVPADDWRRNKARAIVKLLAMAPGHCLHRELLLEALWPELDADASGVNLRKALHFARRALAPDHLRVRGALVCLEAAHLWVDSEAFEASVEAGDTARAVELYAGDLLPEDRFESWSEGPRERLRTRFCQTLLMRARDLEARGDRRGAAGALERLVALDPLDEDAHACLIRLRAEAGERRQAMLLYAQLEERLRQELGVAPGTELQRLRDDVASGRLGPAADWAEAEPGAGRRADPRGAEERKVVTVLFIDVATGGSRGPERSRQLPDSSASLVSSLLEACGATAERRVGASVAGVFSVPLGHEDDAARALRAALKIVERSLIRFSWAPARER